MTLLPLGQGFAREITLTTRKGELGDLPGMIARDCRRILQDSFVAEIGAEYAWLTPQIEV
ncbi:hypothetical protein [Marinobacterium rhizophilum]|uniref:hypothetical protein n=1 Tax=Marinobacterium rhizophilum TaxID=420402 RepID=UPI0003A58303|nr:hypothetical protein [Marinobacterium rhizophilum]